MGSQASSQNSQMPLRVGMPHSHSEAYLVQHPPPPPPPPPPPRNPLTVHKVLQDTFWKLAVNLGCPALH